jgi:hypothetical protein
MQEKTKIGKSISSSIKNQMKKITNPIATFKKNRQGQDIKKKFDLVEKRNIELESKTLEVEDNIKQAKIEALRKVYSLMESLGVDPNNLESIAKFREELTQQDPDLATLFFKAFETLTGGLEEDVEATTNSMQDLGNQSNVNMQQSQMQ